MTLRISFGLMPRELAVHMISRVEIFVPSRDDALV